LYWTFRILPLQIEATLMKAIDYVKMAGRD
jgi:hypothetical protein